MDQNLKNSFRYIGECGKILIEMIPGLENPSVRHLNQIIKAKKLKESTERFIKGDAVTFGDLENLDIFSEIIIQIVKYKNLIIISDSFVSGIKYIKEGYKYLSATNKYPGPKVVKDITKLKVFPQQVYK